MAEISIAERDADAAGRSIAQGRALAARLPAELAGDLGRLFEELASSMA
jgi:hypothetical protein